MKKEIPRITEKDFDAYNDGALLLEFNAKQIKELFRALLLGFNTKQIKELPRAFKRVIKEIKKAELKQKRKLKKDLKQRNLNEE